MRAMGKGSVFCALVLFFFVGGYADTAGVGTNSVDSIEVTEVAKKVPVYFVGEYDANRDPAKDLKGALKLAQKEKKHVLLQVGGDWCGWCHLMTEFFNENKPVREVLQKNFVVMKVNYSSENKNEKFLEAYPKVPAFPHLFILNEKGKVLCSQYTGDLEENSSYSEKVVLDFLNKWTPKAVNEAAKKETEQEEEKKEEKSSISEEAVPNLKD